jgi:hypothetical protein
VRHEFSEHHGVVSEGGNVVRQSALLITRVGRHAQNAPVVDEVTHDPRVAGVHGGVESGPVDSGRRCGVPDAEFDDELHHTHVATRDCRLQNGAKVARHEVVCFLVLFEEQVRYPQTFVDRTPQDRVVWHIHRGMERAAVLAAASPAVRSGL